MKTLRYVCILGLGLSGLIFTSTTFTYFNLSQIQGVVQNFHETEDVITPKVQAILKDQQYKDFIVNNLKSRYENNLALHESYLDFVNKTKQRRMEESIAWGVVFLLFLVATTKAFKQQTDGETK